MWLLALFYALKVRLTYSEYRPQPVRYKTLINWLNQYDRSDWWLLLKLLNGIEYISEDQTRQYLIQRNTSLLNKLKSVGVKKENTIYISFGDAGSSSAAMLNLLRDAALLEKTNCKLFDYKNILEIQETTNELGNGAIIFVDDFIGSGDQFIEARNFISEFIPQNFSQFILSVCICEEALEPLAKLGIQPLAGKIHTRVDRPLHLMGSKIPDSEKNRLLHLSKRLGPRGALGYREMASNVVLYRNSPNTLPRILRGSKTQRPFVGIIPKTTDL